MKYEIINPSDKCFMTCDDEKIVSAAVIFLGKGAFGCKSIELEPKSLPTLFIFGGDYNATWKDRFGVTFDEFMGTPDVYKKLAECFKTFEYAVSRTSLNDIGSAAKWLEESCVKKAGVING